MKKIYMVFFVILGVFLASCTQTQQTQMQEASMMEDKMNHMMAEEGFEMKNGKMMMVNIKTKSESMMQKDALLEDGTKVMTDGKIIRPDGKSFMLKEGESIWVDGMFMSAEDHMEMENSMMNDVKDDKMMPSEYLGKILAGKESKYLEFSKADYDKALSENKKILLYFYASWCPLCKKEQPETIAAFNELNDPDLIGFRVNYKDSDTDSDEEALAKEFQVVYQHTKVILKNGKRVGKFPDSWDKKRYIEELTKI